MDTTRQKKISRQIQKDLSEIFQHITTNELRGTLISVTVVRVTPDLSLAKVYLSIFPTEKTEEVMKLIEQANKQIRHHLAQRVKKQLRKLPELQFILDDSLDYANRIDELLDE